MTPEQLEHCQLVASRSTGTIAGSTMRALLEELKGVAFAERVALHWQTRAKELERGIREHLESTARYDDCDTKQLQELLTAATAAPHKLTSSDSKLTLTIPGVIDGAPLEGFDTDEPFSSELHGD